MRRARRPRARTDEGKSPCRIQHSVAYLDGGINVRLTLRFREPSGRTVERFRFPIESAMVEFSRF